MHGLQIKGQERAWKRWGDWGKATKHLLPSRFARENPRFRHFAPAFGTSSVIRNSWAL